MNLDPASIADHANRATAGGAAVAVTGWLSADVVLAGIGALAAVGSLIVGWYYKRKDDQRADELHQAKLQSIREHNETPDSP